MLRPYSAPSRVKAASSGISLQYTQQLVAVESLAFMVAPFHTLTKAANATADIGLANRKSCFVSQSACCNFHHIHGLPVRKLNYGVHDDLVAMVVGESDDNRLIDLERADWAALQMLRTGITCPEVIGGQLGIGLHPPVAHLAAGCTQHPSTECRHQT